jgi:hypothetical protein
MYWRGSKAPSGPTPSPKRSTNNAQPLRDLSPFVLDYEMLWRGVDGSLFHCAHVPKEQLPGVAPWP